VNEPRTATELAAYEELRAGFTAAVSHELRTPLARLMALLESALLGGADSRELLEQAREEVLLMNELIDEVLFLSELESGREVVSLGSTELEPIVREVFEQLSDRAARANVRLESSIEPGMEVPLRPRLLRVLLENLVGNAISYAGDGARFTLTGARADSALVVEAADDGAGVEPDNLPRLFERFFRGDRARASRGTGLGLAIVKHIVTAAGGTVSASNASDGGLVVRCVFAA
jgi:two-component system, OmpR family, phosphate regulon sensor histidine kinase PhoR